MALGLGIDAGGSATRWALSDGGAGPVARGELGPVSGLLSQPGERTRMTAVARSLAQALGSHRPESIVAGITGLSASAPEAEVVKGILAEALGLDPARVGVADDVWISYHAAFRPGEGHVVYAGTGAVGMHVRVDGTRIQLGGRGALIDDAGAAFGIGRAALQLIYRRLDEDPEWTGRIAECVYEAVGDRTWEAVRSYVYADGRGRIGQLARAVARAADTADADALAILRDAGADLARLARALARREGIKPVALLGRAARLHPAILAAMREAAPGLDIALRDTDPAFAAARLALSPAQ